MSERHEVALRRKTRTRAWALGGLCAAVAVLGLVEPAFGQVGGQLLGTPELLPPANSAGRSDGVISLPSARPRRTPAPYPREPVRYDPGLVQTVGQYDGFQELPVPGGDPLPLPTPAVPRVGGPSLVRRPADDQRFAVDYVYLATADVEDPATDVTFHEIGMVYTHRWPIGPRFRMTFRPLFDVLFLDGPRGPGVDLPEELYKVAIDVQGDFQITETLGISLGITPGFWSDFQSASGDDFRLPARVLGTYQVGNALKIAAGAVYTDNIRRNILPAGGVIWQIDDRLKLEALLPRSRLVYNLHSEWAIYAVVERSDTTWDIKTVYGEEQFEYRDWRVMLGTQVDTFERFSFFVEVGAAFDRRFRFDIQPTMDIDDDFVLRTGIRF